MGTIELPEKGFEPKQGRAASGELSSFFTRAWEQYQAKNPDACITDDRLVRGLRLAWYDHLEGEGFVRQKLSAAASAWYKRVKDNPKYRR